jgi:hypothetical protein
METLYTAFEAQGSIAEIYSLLSLQPVFPSKIQWLTYEIRAELDGVCAIPTLPELETLSVAVSRYRQREYGRTQEIADAALFLGFTALIVPSARWDCLNLVAFPERIEPEHLTVVGSPKVVDWDEWRDQVRALRTRSEDASS